MDLPFKKISFQFYLYYVMAIIVLFLMTDRFIFIMPLACLYGLSLIFKLVFLVKIVSCKNIAISIKNESIVFNHLLLFHKLEIPFQAIEKVDVPQEAVCLKNMENCFASSNLFFRMISKLNKNKLMLYKIEKENIKIISNCVKEYKSDIYQLNLRKSKNKRRGV